jgi:hypothetical protein
VIGFVQRLLESRLELASGLAGIAAHGIVILCAVILGGGATVATRRVLGRWAARIAVYTKTRWDDVLIESGVLRRAAPLAPMIAAYLFSSVFGGAQAWVETALLVGMVGVVLRVIDALFDAGLEIYESYPVSREVSLRGVVRFARIGVVVLGMIFAATTVFDRVPALVGDQLDAVLRADRADDSEDISALIEHAREALERVRDEDAPLSVEGAAFLRAVRDRGPALADAAARRAAEIAEGQGAADADGGMAPEDRVQLADSLQELCALVRETGPDLPAETEERWPTLAESCERIDAALERSDGDGAAPR